MWFGIAVKTPSVFDIGQTAPPEQISAADSASPHARGFWAFHPVISPW
jgi:hypothetical protein